MDHLDGINHCLKKIGAKETFIFKERVQTCTVGNKKFCVVCKVNGAYGFALKSDAELNLVLRQKYAGIVLPRHFDNRYWNIVMLESDIPDDEIFYLIDLSYRLVFSSLSKKVQDALKNDWHQ